MAHHGIEVRHLEEVERQLVEGAGRIASQKVLIAALKKNGLGTVEAENLLRTFEAVQDGASNTEA